MSYEGSSYNCDETKPVRIRTIFRDHAAALARTCDKAPPLPTEAEPGPLDATPVSLPGSPGHKPGWVDLMVAVLKEIEPFNEAWTAARRVIAGFGTLSPSPVPA